MNFFVLKSLIFVVFCPVLITAQFIQQDFNQRFIYRQDNHDWVFYFGNDAMPYLHASANWPLHDQEFVQNFLIYREQFIYLMGEIKKNKYFTDFSYTTLEREYFSGGRNYRLDNLTWQYEGKKNLRMITAPDSNQKTVRLFFENKNDGTDYSKVANAILRVDTAPEISNFDQILGKGWVMVYADYLFENGTVKEIAALKSAEKVEGFSIFVPKDLVDFYVFSRDVSKEKVEKPHPVYCEVKAFNARVDDATYSVLSNFFIDMCSNYDRWGRFALVDFQQFFLEEIERTSYKLSKEQKLNVGQIEIFKREALEYSPNNSADKLVTD